jgi:hypothetical protein
MRYFLGSDVADLSLGMSFRAVQTFGLSLLVISFCQSQKNLSAVEAFSVSSQSSTAVHHHDGVFTRRGEQAVLVSAKYLHHKKISSRRKRGGILSSSFGTTTKTTTTTQRFMLKEGYENSRNESNNRQRRFMNSRRSLKIPLLVLSDDISPVIFPMPLAHVPVTEMSTLNLYGTELTSPAHIRMAQEAIQNDEKLYGHVVYKKKGNDAQEEEGGNNEDEDSLIGSIGVACQIISIGASGSSISKVPEIGPDFMNTAKKDVDATLLSLGGDTENPSPATIFVRGSFRFVVRDVIKTFPYPVAIVDELLDDEIDESDSDSDVNNESDNMAQQQTVEESNDDDDDEDEDDEDIYENLSSPMLMGRTLSAMKVHVQMRVEANPESSLLEQELGGGSSGMTQGELERFSAEEMAAVMEMFLTELVEMNDITLRRYAVGIMAVELLDLGFDQRQKALVTTNGTERLRTVLAILEPKVSMERAKKMASEITGSEPQTDIQKDLQVGRPGLPAWAKQVQPGLKVEYYWNEEYGWCRATVSKAERMFDEILVTLAFDDGQTVIVPLNGEEKARWRPVSNA